MTTNHAAALERARDKVVEAAKEAVRIDGLYDEGSVTQRKWEDGHAGMIEAVDALAELEAATCPECGGVSTLFAGEYDGESGHERWVECPAGCDHGRKRIAKESPL